MRLRLSVRTAAGWPARSRRTASGVAERCGDADEALLHALLGRTPVGDDGWNATDACPLQEPSRLVSWPSRRLHLAPDALDGAVRTLRGLDDGVAVDVIAGHGCCPLGGVPPTTRRARVRADRHPFSVDDVGAASGGGRVRRRVRRPWACPWRRAAAGPTARSASGSETRNVAPPPCVSTTSTVPLCAATIDDTIASPGRCRRSRGCATCRRARSAGRSSRGSAAGCPRRGRAPRGSHGRSVGVDLHPISIGLPSAVKRSALPIRLVTHLADLVLLRHHDRGLGGAAAAAAARCSAV